MGITIDHDEARARFDEAVALSDDPSKLPGEWIARAEQVSTASSKTYVAMLGTALLAKATDVRADPLALKESVSLTRSLSGYSARGVAQHALVPAALRHGVSLGVTGREPLNNQPFYAEDSVHPGMKVGRGDKARADLEFLVGTLEAIRGLSREDALNGLAAFIYVRRKEAQREKEQLDMQLPLFEGRRVQGLDEIIDGLRRFLAKPEDGKRGQALVAGIMDVIFDHVDTARIHDPSRHGAGDVKVMHDSGIGTSIEVKQKAVKDTDVLLFARELEDDRIDAGMYVALEPAKHNFDPDALRPLAIEQYGVALEIIVGVEDLLTRAIGWSGLSAAGFVTELPEKVMARLEDLEVSAEGRRLWIELFTPEDADD